MRWAIGQNGSAIVAPVATSIAACCSQPVSAIRTSPDGAGALSSWARHSSAWRSASVARRIVTLPWWVSCPV
jgi:hypothetical protein